MVIYVNFHRERLRRESSQPYKLGEEVRVRYSSELYTVLDMSFKYLYPKNNQVDFLDHIPLVFDTFFAKRKERSFEQILNQEVIDEAKEHFKYTSPYFIRNIKFDRDVDFLNESKEKYNMSSTETCHFIFFWFADSFVQFYNECSSPLKFPSKSQTRKQAMKAGNQEVVEMSKEHSKIFHFPYNLY